MINIKPNQVHAVLSKYVLADGLPFVVDLKKSHGNWIVDSLTGREYLDCYSQFATMPIGWNHPKLICQQDKIIEAALHKISNQDLYTTQYAEFAESMASITPDFSHYFYIDGGTLAIENSLKAAFDWKAQKMNLTEEESLELDVVHLKNAFHGRSGWGLALSNNSKFIYGGFPRHPWTRVSCPDVNSDGADSLAEIETAMMNGIVAAVIIEPIQSAGGDNHFSNEYLCGIRKLCDEYDAMMILDEIQTGMGITGKWWCYENYDFKPDMIAFGKKAQTCGFCCTKRIDDVENNVFVQPYRMDSTWGGNLVDMVRSTIMIDIVKSDGLISNAAETGAYFLSRLKEVEGSVVSSVRGRGLILAFDLPSPEERDDMIGRLRNKVLAIGCGAKTIRFRPSLTFTKAEVDYAVDCIKSLV